MVEAQVKQGMLCPVCRTDLMMTDRQGVEIDYCPRCRGVWLDRGELDKIIDRSPAAEASAPVAAAAHQVPERPPERYDRDDRSRYRDYDEDRKYYGGHRHYRKKKSWLGDMFDFD
jgi:Zn-finger nucleic acid-binding protein